MPSTYSNNLAIQLIATGDQAGQWGNSTNTNLGTLIESAISGYVVQSFANADITLPMPLGADGGNGSVANPVAARNMTIVCTGALSAQRNLFVPNNTKLYIILNQTTGGFGINVTTVGGSGTVVYPGRSEFLVCNGVNVNNACSSAAVVVGSFTGTLTGVVGTVTNTIYYTVAGGTTAHIQFPIGGLLGQSNSTDCKILGLPDILFPLNQNPFGGQSARVTNVPAFVADGGVTTYGGVNIFQSAGPGTTYIQAFGTHNNGNFSPTGTKGIGGEVLMTYPLL